MMYSRSTPALLVATVFFGAFAPASPAFAAPASPYSNTRTDQTITVVFRMDDYSNDTSSNFDAVVLDEFERHHFPVVFGVIPYSPEKGALSAQSDRDHPLSSTKADRLRPALQSGLLEVAQHGYSHRSVRACRLAGESEFMGVPREVQRANIMKGKALLEGLFGRPITSFCPPFNRYDENTVRVLAALGFTVLSAGGFCHTDDSTPLRYLPGTCKLTQLPRAVEAVRRERDPQPVIVVLFHPYDFQEEDPVRGSLHYADLDAQLTWLAQQRDVRGRTLDQASREIRDLGANRYHVFFQCHAVSRLLPEGLRQRIYPAEAYWTVRRSHMWVVRLSAWLAVLLGAGFLLALLLARAVSRRPFPGTRWYWKGTVALLLAGGAWLLVNPGFPGLFVMTIGAGLIAGRIFSYGPSPQPRA